MVMSKSTGVTRGDVGFVAAWGGAAVASGLVAGIPGVPSIAVEATFVAVVLLVVFAGGRLLGHGQLLVPPDERIDRAVGVVVGISCFLVGLIITIPLTPADLDATPLRSVFYATTTWGILQFAYTASRAMTRAQAQQAEAVPAPDPR